MMFLIALGGALGAVARYLVDFWVVSRGISRIPLGTVVVNVTGSFGLGLLVGVLELTTAPGWLGTFVGAGFLAAYTTFSAWMFEAARLVQRGAYAAAAVSLLGSIVAGVLAAAAGLAAAFLVLGGA
jgi:fluoride exporter